MIELLKFKTYSVQEFIAAKIHTTKSKAINDNFQIQLLAQQSVFIILSHRVRFQISSQYLADNENDSQQTKTTV
jgi:hypothetical protein